MLTLFEIFAVSILGLAMGSFATAMVWRVPRGISWIGRLKASSWNDIAARSRCPACEHKLSVIDLVPFFSWLFLRGRCRYCRGRIDPSYPLTELAAMGLCLGLYAVWGWGCPLFILMLLVPFLLALFVIDLQHMILPDQLNLAAGIIGVLFILYQLVADNFSSAALSDAGGHVLAALIFPGGVWLVAKLLGVVLKKDTLGLGDVKFLAVAGLWLGVGWLPVYLIVSGLVGIAFGVGWRVFLKSDYFPFGPALILSLYLGILASGAGIDPSGLFN